MKKNFLQCISIVVIVSLCQCLTLTLGWTGRGIDEVFDLKYREECNSYSLEEIPTYPFTNLGRFGGLMADIAFAFSIGATHGIINFIYGVSYFFITLISFGFGSLGHPHMQTRSFGGWAGDHKEKCKTQKDFFYKNYELPFKLPIKKTNIPNIEKDNYDLFCKDELIPIANENILKDMVNSTIKENLTNNEIYQLIQKIKQRNSIKLETASCSNRFQGVDNFLRKREFFIICNCIFYVKIEGGKKAIINLK